MPPAQQTLVALQERLAPRMVEEQRSLATQQVAAVGNLAVTRELQESSEQRLCAGLVRNFANEYIPAELIAKDRANESLLEFACAVTAKNWLQDGAETVQDSRVIADILLALFKAVPSNVRTDAINKLGKLRNKFGSAWREEDTTRGLLGMLRTDARPTKSTKFVQRNLTTEQYKQFLAAKSPGRAVDSQISGDSSAVETVWENNRLTFRQPQQ